MSWIKRKANLFLLVASSLLALILFELLYAAFLKREDIYAWDRRYMLFRDGNGGSVFRSLGSYFKYDPNRRMESTTYYHVDGAWIKEYDYVIPTNNLGLVQTSATIPDIPSLLLLGNSFTEGQGASPWFDEFSRFLSTRNIQPVNGGLLGTGFQQWKLLHDHLRNEGVQVRYLVVIFNSGDYTRGVFSFASNTKACIADYKRCVGDENFYGKPPAEEVSAFLEKLRAYREERLASTQSRGLKGASKHFFPATRMVLKYVRDSVGATDILSGGEERRNRKVVADLIHQYGDNVVFVHIPQKDEVKYKTIARVGRNAIRDIKSLGGQLYDGNNQCKFTLDDYFVNDGHPNARGYQRISKCVLAAVRDKWGVQ